jgi:hypothetical protein
MARWNWPDRAAFTAKSAKERKGHEGLGVFLLEGGLIVWYLPDYAIQSGAKNLIGR